MLLEVLKKIRYMNDTEFGMLCNLLGLSESGQSSGAQLQSQVVPAQDNATGVQTVPVTAQPSAMYPMNEAQKVQLSSMYGTHGSVPPQMTGAQPPVANNAQTGQKAQHVWHNLNVVSDPNFETDKAYAYMFKWNEVLCCLFISRKMIRMYNNVMQYGIKEDSFYTVYKIDDYNAKTKTQLQPVNGKDLAAILGV